LKDVTLHVVDSGTIGRPVIIFVHDFLQNWRTWTKQLRQLSGRFRTIAVDLRGYGLSERKRSLAQYSIDRLARDISDLAVKVRSECVCARNRDDCDCARQPIVVCGVGLGGTLAWLLACDRRPEVDRVVIIGAPHPSVHLRLLQRCATLWLSSWFVAFAQLPILPEMFLLANDLSCLKRIYRQYATQSSLIDATELNCLKASLCQLTAMTHALSCYRSTAHFDHTILTDPKARIPVLLLFGQSDPLCQTRLTHESVRVSGQAQLVVLPRSERYAHLDAAQTVNLLVKRFSDCHNNNDDHYAIK
jgi:pimeloyl-ACP methyl ester carboxylesterase